ncbi:MAG TPA: hypothetical protein PKX87_05980 [Alphaproteobacteria bacterium]|nr:hypothetical protein [Alphaproteobacteria bacterium]
MVNPLSGGAQQPFGTLYQPGGASKSDQRVPAENRSRTGEKEDAQPAKLFGRESGKDVDSGKSSEKLADAGSPSYKKDSCSSGNCQRGQVLNITV